MPKFGDDATKLFRTLGPDDSNYRAAATTAAREAEHRWPLLKNTLPKKFETTPDLTEQEKSNWDTQKQIDSEERKLTLPSSLTMPSTHDKFAESLMKMSGSTLKNPPTKSVKNSLLTMKAMDVKKPLKDEEATVVKKPLVTKAVDEIKWPLRRNKVVEIKTPIEVEKSRALKISSTLVNRIETKVIQNTLTSLKTVPEEKNTSLRGMFARLTGEKKTPDIPAVERISILSKLSKR